MLKKLKAERAKQTKIMSDVASTERAAGTHMTDAEKQTFDNAKNKVIEIDAEVARLEELRSLQTETAVEVKSEDESQEFRNFLQNKEVRSQTVGTNSQGGFTAGAGVQNRLIEAMKTIGGMVANASSISTSNGNEISYPTMDDTSSTNDAVIKSETDARREGPDLVFGSIPLKAFVFDSGIIKISNELVQDSSVNIEQVVISALSKRIARKLNTDFTNGVGTTAPAGITTQTTLGVTAASATAITADELLDLQFSIDSAYNANAKYMMNKATYLKVRKLKDNDGHYLIKDNKIHDKEIVVNDDMPNATAGKKAVIYGDLSAYMIRNVENLSIFKFAELYQETNEIGFKASFRADGCLLNPAAVKHLAMKAS